MLDTFDTPVAADVLQKTLESYPLAVWDGVGHSWRPIPVALRPVVLEKAKWQAVASEARAVLSCFPMLLAWLQRPEQGELFQAIFSQLEGIESLAASRQPEETWGHATLRFDLYWHDDDLKIIEANCTIPAMQAYSDMVRDAWLKAAGLSVMTQSNSKDLLDSLIALYRKNCGTKKRPQILILHRDGDSQLAELLHYEKSWSRYVDVVRATPEQCQVGKSSLSVGGKSADIVYRHIFGWRLEDWPEFKEPLMRSSEFQIYNPLSAHYEVKAFLALLSQVCDDDRLSSGVGVTTTQRLAVQKRVPWTRVIPAGRHGALIGTLGHSKEALSRDHVDFVVKNSLGYGGHQVFMGSEWHSDDTQARLKKFLKQDSVIEPMAFFKWVEEESKDTWIIQKRLKGRQHRTRILTAQGVEEVQNVYVDASIFLNSGDTALCGGGVSRFASGPVVNIGAGGGLAPFIVT